MAKKKESKTKVERTYNIPLRKSFRHKAKYKKTPRAVRTVKEFLEKHMKCENILLGAHLNEYLWKHGIKNPPHHAAVDVIKEGDVVKAELKGFKFKGAVKIEKKKEEASSMKDKLEAKLGVKGGKKESDADTEEVETNEQETKTATKEKPETESKDAEAVVEPVVKKQKVETSKAPATKPSSTKK